MMRVLSAGALALLLSAPVAAQDVQSWTTLVAQGPIDGRLLVLGEVQSRLVDDLNRFGLVSGRVGVGVRLNHQIDLMAGYHYQFRPLGAGITTSEHRFWQQVQLPVLRQADGLAFTLRARLEERMFENAHDLGWRLRLQYRLQQPLHGPGSAGPVVFGETFLALNSTDWGAHAGLDQQRFFVGWSQPLSRRLTLESGYLHIDFNRPGRNVANHVINVTLTRRLG